MNIYIHTTVHHYPHHPLLPSLCCHHPIYNDAPARSLSHNTTPKMNRTVSTVGHWDSSNSNGRKKNNASTVDDRQKSSRTMTTKTTTTMRRHTTTVPVSTTTSTATVTATAVAISETVIVERSSLLLSQSHDGSPPFYWNESTWKWQYFHDQKHTNYPCLCYSFTDIVKRYSIFDSFGVSLSRASLSSTKSELVWCLLFWLTGDESPFCYGTGTVALWW